MSYRAGSVIVTHDGAQYLPELIASIETQTRLPDRIVVVDDASSDETWNVLEGWRRTSSIEINLLRSENEEESDLRTRIARNFEQGLRGIVDCEYIALSDQDDIWNSERIEFQSSALEAYESVLMLGGNGNLFGSSSERNASDLRSTYSWPDWDSLSKNDQWNWILRHPIVTGGASMIRRELLETGLPIPPTWLHDRWLSLVAAAAGGLEMNVFPVIEYRLHENQSLGISGAKGEGSRRATSASNRGTSIKALLRRSHSLRRRVNPLLIESGVADSVSSLDLIRIGLARNS